MWRSRIPFPSAASGLLWVALPCFLLGSFLWSSCNGGPPTWTQAPVILISVDTLRSDRLPVYGYDALSTPAIETLARDGVVFEHAFAHVPLTLPSHLTVFTGLLPHRHGVRSNVGYSVELDSLPYLPEFLKEQGYALGGAVSALPLARRSGFGDGFDFFDDDDGFDRESLHQRAGLDTLKASLPWLQRTVDEKKPFFFFFHLFEPHQSVVSEAAFTADGHSSYDAEVAHADHVVGALLDELRRLGVYDQALIMLISDHGEGLGDHGEVEHGMLLYREALQVPWILKLPNNKSAGARIDGAVGLVDLLPTLLDLIGIGIDTQNPDMQLDGRSRVDAIFGEQVPSEPILAETLYPRLEMGWSELFSVIRGPHHLIQGPRSELYHWLQDPGQTQDLLAAEQPDDTIRRPLAELRRDLGEFDPQFVPAGEVSGEQEAALASLGYVGTSSSSSESTISPIDRIEVYETYRLGRKAFVEEDWTEAEGLLRQVLAQDPEILDAWLLLGSALDRQGRPTEALDAFLIGGPRSDRSLEIASEVNSLCARLGRDRDCPTWLESFVTAQPTEVRLRFLWAQSLARSGRIPAASDVAEDTVKLAPDNLDALYLRGTLRALTGKLVEAEQDLKRAVDLSGETYLPAMVDLSLLLYDKGDPDSLVEARRLVGLARFIAPEDPSLQSAAERMGL